MFLRARMKNKGGEHRPLWPSTTQSGAFDTSIRCETYFLSPLMPFHDRYFWKSQNDSWSGVEVE
jgi:hypothetical protein